MDAHSIKTWAAIFTKTDATTVSAEHAIANRIIGDLVGYRHNSNHRSEDIKQLANAIQAYAFMLQEAGVKVVAK